MEYKQKYFKYSIDIDKINGGNPSNIETLIISKPELVTDKSYEMNKIRITENVLDQIIKLLKKL